MNYSVAVWENDAIIASIKNHLGLENQEPYEVVEVFVKRYLIDKAVEKGVSQRTAKYTVDNVFNDTIKSLKNHTRYMVVPQSYTSSNNKDWDTVSDWCVFDSFADVDGMQPARVVSGPRHHCQVIADLLNSNEVKVSYPEPTKS